RISLPAALKVGREGVRRVRNVVSIQEGQAGLTAVSAGQPAQEVIERSVLHHHEDDVIDPRQLRRRQRGGRSGGNKWFEAAEAGSTHGRSKAMKELASRHHAVVLSTLQTSDFRLETSDLLFDRRRRAAMVRGLFV